MKIILDKPVCNDLEGAIEKEWLETNGIGGYAASTVIGMNTRRYHGLLIASLRPSLERVLLLSKLEEALLVNDQAYEFSCNRYPGVIFPQGYQYLEQFRLDPFPIFTYRFALPDSTFITLEKAVVMIHGENTTLIRYALLSIEGNPSSTLNCRLRLRPLIAFRDHHSLTHENPVLNPQVEMQEGSVGEMQEGSIRMRPYEVHPDLHLVYSRGSYTHQPVWYRNFEYSAELRRGLDYREDLFNPGSLTVPLTPPDSVYLIASTTSYTPEYGEELLSRELKRRAALLKNFENSGDSVKALVTAADSFMVQKGKTFRTLIAGYPWFGDWGRDTMIALPGLTLTTRRYEEARDILRSYASTCSQGLIPNYFPEHGETPEYNAVDASLWYIQAVQQYLSYTRDFDTLRQELYDLLKEIIRFYQEGTRYQIHMEEDGLIYAGEEGIQLTWMDVKAGNWMITRRQGKAVEVNALWYNALKFMEGLADEFRDAKGKEYKKLAQKVKKSFNDLFWNPEGHYLYDRIDGEARDASIRPNQIFAISLPQPLLTKEKGKRVLEVVRQHLLTPYGLRSLAPTDEKYIGRYEGNPWERDKAYHQGTVWTWLIGPFFTAYLKIYGRSPKTRKTISDWLSSFLAHLSQAGLGTISEIFDGDPPHTPRGCISQAWSVAEVLRVMQDEV